MGEAERDGGNRRRNLGRGRPGVRREAQELHGLAAPHRAALAPAPAAAAALPDQVSGRWRKARVSLAHDESSGESHSTTSFVFAAPPDAAVASHKPSDLPSADPTARKPPYD